MGKAPMCELLWDFVTAYGIGVLYLSCASRVIHKVSRS